MDQKTKDANSLRNRRTTEDSLLNAARKVFEEEGVLSGLNLAKVADEAGANRGLIYQYFGSRRDLLRAALSEKAWRELPVLTKEARDQSFKEWRLQIFQDAIRHSRYMKISAILTIDEDPSHTLWPELALVLAAMSRDQNSGLIPQTTNLKALHALISSIVRGYSIFREQFANELDMDIDELDKNVLAIFEDVLTNICDKKT